MVTPSRITLARKRRGMTIVELSRKVGISAQSLSNYEHGRQHPSEETLSKLSDTLNFPESFFLGADLDEIPSGSVAFRARSKLTAGRRDVALSVGRLALELDEEISKRFRLPVADIPSLDKPDPESAAEMIRSRWDLGQTAISNLVHLLESKGVRVFSLAPEYSEIDAFSFWHQEKPFIFLNTLKSAERGRFDAAHELGHLVMHGPVRSLTGPEAEQEANAFASAFLMPRRSVVAHMPKGPFIDQILKGRKIWKVAALALTYRLHDLDMLSDWQYRTAIVELSKRGYRTGEPGGIQRETSQVFGKVFKALRDKGVSAADVAKSINIEPDELSKYVFGLTLTSQGGEGVRTSAPRPALKLISSDTDAAPVHKVKRAARG
ncbi:MULTISPECIES: helix-turn-helix domain-containing protein [unclassified Streptomyces]|uniref:helix-turn-helix domain-containing protein n=1 Tax=unclassified Streptomyces TaxID=2593676 RepID=UPI0022AA6B96|nr:MULTISPECIES: XRE family transcriptional regulator [unclassified Streptomyces]